MKSFNEWLLEYNAFQHHMKKRDGALRRPGFPTQRKNDSFSKVSPFERLKYLVSQVRAGREPLKHALRQIRSRGLFPEFFPFKAGSPGSGNLFAGFTVQQLKELEDVSGSQKADVGAAKSPRSIEMGKRIQEQKKRRAVEKIPLHVRVLLAARIEDNKHDMWQQLSEDDWKALKNKESPRYDDLTKYFRALGYLGSDAKEFNWFGQRGLKSDGMSWDELEDYLIKLGYSL